MQCLRSALRSSEAAKEADRAPPRCVAAQELLLEVGKEKALAQASHQPVLSRVQELSSVKARVVLMEEESWRPESTAYAPSSWPLAFKAAVFMK